MGGGKKWSYGKIIKDKSLRLLIPGLVFSLVALALKIAFAGEMSRQAGLSLQEIAHSYLYPKDNPMRELWFIATLFWFFIMTPLWKWALEKKWIIWAMMIILVILHFFHPQTEFLCIGRVFSYAIWFYLGLVISKEEWIEKYANNNAFWVLLIGITIYIAGRYSSVFVATIGGITFSFALALIADKNLSKLFWSFRNYTYQIFLMGIFAQMFVKIVFKHVELPYIPVFLLCVAVGLYVPVLVSKMIEWINWKPLLLSMGLKKQSKK